MIYHSIMRNISIWNCGFTENWGDFCWQSKSLWSIKFLIKSEFWSKTYIVLSREEEDGNMKFVSKLEFSDKNNIVVTNYIFGIKKIKENEEILNMFIFL